MAWQHSFYNDKNGDIAEALTKLLVETHQTVPDFLESYKPENEEELKFDDDTDNGGDETAAGGDAWGGEAQTTNGDSSWRCQKEHPTTPPLDQRH